MSCSPSSQAVPPALVAQPLHLCQGMCLGEAAQETGGAAEPWPPEAAHRSGRGARGSEGTGTPNASQGHKCSLERRVRHSPNSFSLVSIWPLQEVSLSFPCSLQARGPRRFLEVKVVVAAVGCAWAFSLLSSISQGFSETETGGWGLWIQGPGLLRPPSSQGGPSPCLLS